MSFRWEHGEVETGPNGRDRRIQSCDAFVGKQHVGHVQPSRSRHDRWDWQVYQCNASAIHAGTLETIEEAKEAIEKRVFKWFKLAGLPLKAA